MRQPHRCGLTFGFSALGRTRRAGVLKAVGAAACTSSVQSERRGSRRPVLTLSSGHPSLFAGVAFVPLRVWASSQASSASAVAAALAAARLMRCPVANAPSSAVRQDPTDRVGAEPTMSTFPQRSTLRKTGPKRLSEASIQSFSARTGQARRDATRRTATVRSAPR